MVLAVQYSVMPSAAQSLIDRPGFLEDLDDLEADLEVFNRAPGGGFHPPSGSLGPRPIQSLAHETAAFDDVDDLPDAIELPGMFEHPTHLGASSDEVAVQTTSLRSRPVLWLKTWLTPSLALSLTTAGVVAVMMFLGAVGAATIFHARLVQLLARL